MKVTERDTSFFCFEFQFFPFNKRNFREMIKSILVINNQGKIRLSKFYVPLTEEQQQSVVREIFSVLNRRSERACNFVDMTGDVLALLGGDGSRIVYRHYATLYFAFVVDQSESELGTLDLIQVFVEALDRCFENVCELDLIFHLDKIHFVLDEIIHGGLVNEMQLDAIHASLVEQKKISDSAKEAKPTSLGKTRL